MADIFGDSAAVEENSAAVEAQVEDPAAEFLAQQQDEIEGLENDVLGGVEQSEVVENGFGEVAEPVNTDDLFGGGAVENGVDEVDEATAETMDPSQAYAAIAAANTRIEQLKAEPEKIRLWREENNKLIAEKDAEAERQKEEWLAQAKKELEDWDKNRQEQLEKTRESNRAAEEQFVKDRDNATPGSEWERVSRLCDFNPKAAGKSSKDVSRMRSSLLHLKQNPRPITSALSANQ